MGGLFYSLHLGLTSLRAQQLGLSVAGNNVANVNTPGYARQRAIMSELTGMQITEGQLGRGVHIQAIDAARDRFIEARLAQANSRLGQQQTLNQNLRQIEGVFAETGGVGLRDSLSKFFNSFSDLANNPTNTALRQQVLSSGNNLAASIRNAYTQLTTTQNLANQDIKNSVDQINGLTAQIAALNVQVARIEGLGQDAAQLRDQRQLLIGQLGELINVSYLEGENGVVSVNLGGRSLVEGSQATALTATAVAGSNYSIFLNGTNVTSEITSGKINGLLQIRDTNIPNYLQSLETFAGTLITQVNTVHSAGYDLTRAAGGNFFTPPAPGASAAQNIAVAITSTDNIAAASTLPASGTPTDGNNATAMARLATTRIAALGSVTFTEYYGGLVARVGSHAREAADGFSAQRQIVRQIQNQRDSISGVSLDEEMANIIQYQKAYEASARFINIVNSLTEETMRLVGGRSL